MQSVGNSFFKNGEVDVRVAAIDVGEDSGVKTDFGNDQRKLKVVGGNDDFLF